MVLQGRRLVTRAWSRRVGRVLFSGSNGVGGVGIRPEKKNLDQLFSKFSDHWSPKIVGEINSMHLKIVKVEGDFVWHHHDVEDEMFLVTNGGPLHMKIRDPEERVEIVNKGEFIIIPAGVEHCPCTEKECEIILLEPSTTLNTGNVKDDVKTVNDLETI